MTGKDLKRLALLVGFGGDMNDVRVLATDEDWDRLASRLADEAFLSGREWAIWQVEMMAVLPVEPKQTEPVFKQGGVDHAAAAAELPNSTTGGQQFVEAEPETDEKPIDYSAITAALSAR